MPRGRTERIHEAKRLILERLRNGLFRPGDRFASNRQIAEQYGLSYQTAHRLIDELCREGHLIRRPRSGTYVARTAEHLDGAHLIFGHRARRDGSFGAKLLELLNQKLTANHIDTTIGFDTAQTTGNRLAVLWEAPEAMRGCIETQRPALLINDRPPASIDTRFVDSVGMDDYLGGAYAAQLLIRHGASDKKVAVMSGPEEDRRSGDRVAGFHSVLPEAPQVVAGGWYFEDGHRKAEEALDAAEEGLFCCNDRLAEAVTAWCRKHRRREPKLIGFDDAPVAARMNLTTIAIPWEELVESAVRVIKRRLAGDRSVASHHLLNPRPVVRRI